MLVLLQVSIELVKQPGRTLGFSIAGGRGSTPAYEDVDEVYIYNLCTYICLQKWETFPPHVGPSACYIYMYRYSCEITSSLKTCMYT